MFTHLHRRSRRLQQRGRIEISGHWKTWFRTLLHTNGWNLLPITGEIIEEAWSLLEPIHRDPADPSIGWDWPESGNRLKVPSVQGFRELEVIAEKKGVKVLLVPPLANGSIMPSDERKKLEAAVTPLAAEHPLIFVDQVKTRQVWLWTSRLPGNPIRRRELNWEKGRSNELLLQKVISIAFSLDEEEGRDLPITSDAAFKKPTDEDRLLILSPFPYGKPSRPTKESCSLRNRFVLGRTADRFIPHVAMGSSLAADLESHLL